MKFVRMNRLILASLFFLLSFVCVNVNATTYGDIETRIIQNTNTKNTIKSNVSKENFRSFSFDILRIYLVYLKFYIYLEWNFFIKTSNWRFF